MVGYSIFYAFFSTVFQMEVLEFAPLRNDSQTHPASQWPNLPVTMGVQLCVICMAVPPICT